MRRVLSTAVRGIRRQSGVRMWWEHRQQLLTTVGEVDDAASHRCRATRGQLLFLKTLDGKPRPESRNLALAVLNVPYSLDSGRQFDDYLMVLVASQKESSVCNGVATRWTTDLPSPVIMPLCNQLWGLMWRKFGHVAPTHWGFRYDRSSPRG